LHYIELSLSPVTPRPIRLRSIFRFLLRASPAVIDLESGCPCSIVDAAGCTGVAASIVDDVDVGPAQCPCFDTIGDGATELVALRKVDTGDVAE
jgi:hypothetical protein